MVHAVWAMARCFRRARCASRVHGCRTWMPSSSPHGEQSWRKPVRGNPFLGAYVCDDLHEVCWVNLAGEELAVQAAIERWQGKTLVRDGGHRPPQRFFSQLARLGFQCDEQRAMPDHHAYAPPDIDSCAADIVLVTEKDAVKLARCC